MRGIIPSIGLIALLAGCGASPEIRLRNASFDPTRELYEEINADFARSWKDSTGQDVLILQSHGGSGKQARAVIDGLQADMVSLALSYDIDQIARKANLIPETWADNAPSRSVPFSSTIVFLVRSGNPKGIQDWADLARPGVSVVTPNPLTSGGARWNWLAAWGSALLDGLDSAQAAQRCRAIWRNVPVQDAGARAATTTFALRGIGDVLITWENEAMLAAREIDEEHFEVIHPGASIRAEPPVVVVDSVCARRGTCTVARAWLANLWTTRSQESAARNGFRPTDSVILARESARFPALRQFTVDSLFGGWTKVQKEHFGEGGIFQRLVLEDHP